MTSFTLKRYGSDNSKNDETIDMKSKGINVVSGFILPTPDSSSTNNGKRRDYVFMYS